MNWLPLILLIVVLGCTLYSYLHFDLRGRNKKRAEAAELLLQRRPAQLAAPQEAYTAAELKIAPRVLRVIAQISSTAVCPPKTEIDPAVLLPEDHLMDNLGFHFDSIAYLDMVFKLEKEFGCNFHRRDPTPMTVHGVAKWIAAEIAERADQVG
jgi:acyl carrier protein